MLSPATIRAEIARRGSKPSVVAKLLGLAHSDVSRALNEKSRNPTEAKRILTALSAWVQKEQR